MIHLDTNFLIALENPEMSAADRFTSWLEAEEEMGVSALVWTEYLCGPLSAEKREAAAILFPIREPYLAEDAPLAARLFNATVRRRGTMLDAMIAATALRCGAQLATLNLEDFRPFEPFGLVLR